MNLPPDEVEKRRPRVIILEKLSCPVMSSTSVPALLRELCRVRFRVSSITLGKVRVPYVPLPKQADQGVELLQNAVILWQAYLEEVQAVSEDRGLSRYQAALLVTVPGHSENERVVETPGESRRVDKDLTRVDESHRQRLVEWIGRGDNNATWPKTPP